MAFQECFWHLWRTKETAMHHKDLLFDDRKEWQKKKELLKSLINTCRCWRFKIVAIKLCQPAKRTALTCVDSETLLLFFLSKRKSPVFFHHLGGEENLAPIYYIYRATWPVLCQAFLCKTTSKAPRALVELFILMIAPQDMHLLQRKAAKFSKKRAGLKGFIW